MMNCLLFYLICGILMLLIIYKQRKCWHFVWQLNGWRGLLQQPILWLLLIIYLEPKSIMNTIQRCHKYFQFPLAIIVFNRILLYVDDPETMESVLTAQECINKTFLQNGFYANKGLLHAKDEHWKIRRKQLNPAFSHNTLIGFFKVFNRAAKELQLKISEDFQDCKGKFKSLDDLITRAVLEVSCLTTMGYKTKLLQHDEKSIAQAYRYLMELTALRILRPWYQIDFVFCLLDKENYEKAKKANKLVNEFVANIVQQKRIEWQEKLSLHRKPDIRSSMSDCTTASNRNQDEMLLLNENSKNNNFASNMAAAASDALKYTAKETLSLPDTNTDLNLFLPQPQPQQQQQQQEQRIFIDQLFHLAQTGKLTLQDIVDESQSMIVVSFETVSSCIMNALLCLAVNRECQVKLRHEIKQVTVVLKNKAGNKNKNVATTTNKLHNDAARKIPTNLNEKRTNTIDSDLDCVTTANLDHKGDVNNSCGSNDDDDDVGDGGGDEEVTMEDLLNMPYLDMIINESLRLLTTVPMNLRNASADFQLHVIQRDKCTCNMKNHNNKHNYNCHCSRRHSVVVPKGTIIALDTFNMQRNEKYWGEKALKFYPEHFGKKPSVQQQQSKGSNEKQEKINETQTASITRHSYSFIPFSKGLRTCIGYRYSIYLSKIVLIKLISSFEFSTNIQLEDLQCYEGVSLKFRNANQIHFQIHPVE